METATESTRPLTFPALRDRGRPVHRIADRLEPYLRALVEKLHPERVILFGSYAYGEPDEHSDVDLLVVREGITSEIQSNIEARRIFWNVPGELFSFTILSKTPDRIRNRVECRSPFYEEILGKGLTVYEARTN